MPNIWNPLSFPGSHTAERISEALKKVFRAWGIINKIVGGTTDNGKNYVAAMVRGQLMSHYVYCSDLNRN
jgi:hypothetical protein